MRPLVIQIEDTERKVAQTVAFRSSPIRIGRNALNELQLEEGFVSQWHAVIRMQGDRTTFLDLGAKNPSKINGVAIQRNTEVEVDADTSVRIGSLRLHLHRVDSAPDELFSRKRKSAFARRAGGPDDDLPTSTVFLSDSAPPAPTQPLSGGRISVSAPRAEATRVGGVAVSAVPVAGIARSSRASGVPGPARETPTSQGPAPRSIRSDYEAFVGARQRLMATVQDFLARAPQNARRQLLQSLLSEHPELADAKELRGLANTLGIDPNETGRPAMEDWLRRLTGGLLPPPTAPLNVAYTMERTGEILELFAQAFVDVAQKQAQFRSDMGLSNAAQGSDLLRIGEPTNLLGYLLNPHPDATDRPDELAAGLADFAVHDVALVSAVVEGARELLRELDPEKAEDQDDAASGGMLRGLLGRTKAPHWERYKEAFEDLMDGDRFIKALFGRAFARQYHAIMGNPSTSPGLDDRGRRK